MKSKSLDDLRDEMKIVTNQIILLINKRMEIAEKIGEIKTKLDMDVVDDKVEQEIKNYLFKNSKLKQNTAEFTGRIVNLLIDESVRVQNDQKQKILNDPNIRNNNKTLYIHDKEKKSFTKPVDMSKTIIKSHMDVFNLAKQLDAQGKNIIHMEVGELDLFPPKSIKDELGRIYEKGRFHYTQSPGIIQLRNKLTEYLNQFSNTDYKEKSTEMNPQNLLVTPGGRFAIFCAFTVLLKPGDEIITIEPVWPAYRDCANFLGVKTRILKTRIEEDWEPNLSDLENLINVNTKIICLNYPNNPTGKILSENTLKKIIDIAQRRQIYILSDEVYSKYSYKDFHSILSYQYPRQIMIGSFSKTFAMTGFRVGFAYSPEKELINKMIRFQSLSLTSVAEPMQHCALAALNSEEIDYSTTIKRRLDILCSSLEKMPFKFNFPDGGMYVYAKIDESLEINDLNLIEKLLERGVALAPGSGFGNSYTNFIRISACIEEKKIIQGLEIISKTIQDF